MRRSRKFVHESDPSDIDDALEVLDTEELRELIRELMFELDGGLRGRVIDRVVELATRKDTGWAPKGPTEDAVAEIVMFAEASRRAGYAEPHLVDAYLRRGLDAFQRRDYEAARQVFGALLPPIGDGDIDLGQDELVDEVLNVDEALCAARYVVSIYMTSASVHRAAAVHAAIREVGGLGVFEKPLEELERVTLEPLPDLDDFVPRWRAFVEENTSGDSRDGWVSNEDRWLSEVIQRTDGTDGLAKLARSTRHGEDLQVWCRALVEAGEWKAALSAFEEAAGHVRDGVSWRGEFLDGAALAAQELGRKDLPTRLENAWRAEPSLLRLRRWLGSARTKARVRKLAAGALEACPKRAGRQRALLHLVLGDYESAAKRLAAAPGLGWSDAEHPGHLLVSLFRGLLGGRAAEAPCPERAPAARGLDLDEPEWVGAEPDEPRLRAPEIVEILETAVGHGPIRGAARAVVLAAMRTAAKKRVEGVTKKQRRRYYAHAAQLVATCAALDTSASTGKWVEGLRASYTRYPALRRELNEHMGKA